MTLKAAQIIHKYGDFLFGVEIIEDYKPDPGAMPVDVTTAVRLESPLDLLRIQMELVENATDEEKEEVEGVIIMAIDINLKKLKGSVVIY